MDTGTADLDGAFGDSYLFHQLDEYPWERDQEFQGGLRAILGSVQDPAQVEHLTLRAKCYYFARKAGTHVDFDGYKQWVETQRAGGPSLPPPSHANGSDSGQVEAGGPVEPTEADEGGVGGGMGDAPKPASFAEICDMIAEGKPIPGIKDIPDTILEGRASEKQAQTRRKPWEKDARAEADENERPSWMR